MSNVYYDPEHFGLTIVLETEYSDQCYQYDTRVIWRDAHGKLYTARDSGCSCPTPFEDFKGLLDLEPFDLDALIAESKNEANDDWGPYGTESHLDTVRALRELARGATEAQGT